MNEPLVSVIIPTFRDEARLRFCIDCLMAQTYPRDRFEVIVVNNDPASREASRRWFNDGCVKVITENSPGSYNARNRGASAATGQILAFTDSDCRPKPDWLAQLADCMSRNYADIVTGGIHMIAKDPSQITAIEAYDFATGLPQESLARQKRGVTANMAVKAARFSSVGGFDGTRLSGGDLEICQRIEAAGGHFAYCEGAVVCHPLRSQWHEVISKARRVAGAKANVSSREIVRTIPRLATAQLNALRLISFSDDLSLRQKIKAIGVLGIVKIVQGWEFLRILLCRTKGLR